MEFNTLLTLQGISPGETILVRHRPREPELDRHLPRIVAERPDLYQNFQQFQGRILEKALHRARFLASFIRSGSARALFTGLYEVGGHEMLTREQARTMPASQELMAMGMRGFQPEQEKRDRIACFEMRPVDFYTRWIGKLSIEWPGGERSWWRWAHRNTMPVHAIAEESMLVMRLPEWPDIRLAWDELQMLPLSWRLSLAQWRGVYLIHDRSSGRSYVGSAYGEDNILGRWLNYAASGHGGNQKLRPLNPKNFVFTILQLVAPDMPADDVIRLEETWKYRLHTRGDHGLN